MWVCGVCLVGVGLCPGTRFYKAGGYVCSFKVTMEIMMSMFSLLTQQNSHAVELGLSIEKSSQQQFHGPQENKDV